MTADWGARWSRTAGALGIAADQRECDAVLARYAEPQRWYHTLRHLDECFDRLERVRSTVERPGELDLALWYHDAVYDPLANDNEARSADLAVGAMEHARLTEAARDRVRAP